MEKIRPVETSQQIVVTIPPFKIIVPKPMYIAPFPAEALLQKSPTDVYLYFSDNFVVISFCDSTNTWLANEIGEI